jgi:hypothetical protein
VASSKGGDQDPDAFRPNTTLTFSATASHCNRNAYRLISLPISGLLSGRVSLLRLFHFCGGMDAGWQVRILSGAQ